MSTTTRTPAPFPSTTIQLTPRERFLAPIAPATNEHGNSITELHVQTITIDPMTNRFSLQGEDGYGNFETEDEDHAAYEVPELLANADPATRTLLYAELHEEHVPQHELLQPRTLKDRLQGRRKPAYTSNYDAPTTQQPANNVLQFRPSSKGAKR
jgi:hypothetical protein